MDGEILRYAFLAALVSASLLQSTAHAESQRPYWADFLTETQWQAIQVFEPADRYSMTQIAFCESRIDETAYIIDTDGLPRKGAWMVGEVWWGKVPDTLFEQAIQASKIVSEHGTSPWTTRHGCRDWWVP